MASGGCRPDTHPRSRSLDLSGIQQEQPMWLVKVPKYLSQQWAGAPGSGEVGKLQVVQSPGQREAFFTLKEGLTRIQDPAGGPVLLRAPREHQVLPQRVRGQALAVMTEDAQARLSLEGAVVQRLECRPAARERYLRLKRMQTERSLSLARTAQILDMPVTTSYRPVANHQCNIEYEKKKKEDGKGVRADKDQVLALLFAAFEKHQYYCWKDLVGITLQPVLYLKEILREIAVRVVQGRHKNSWKLKAEYRHYRAAAKAEGADLHPGRAVPPKTELGEN